ncbi:MAG: hypothetical protein QM756_02715 [Polyangiaceae bacterium]
MHISFEKFLKITALLAGSAAIAGGCTIEKVGNGEGGASNSGGSATSGGNGGSGGKLDAGAPSHEGGAPSAEGGSGGDIATGGDSTIGGAGGAGGMAPSTDAGAGGDGEAGGAGGAAACVSGSPAEEGGGFDCATLPFLNQTCPNPSGEGLPVPAPGLELCERYADDRSGSVQVLTDCLKKLPTTSLCSDTAKAQATACEATMQDRTCAASEASVACAAIHGKCAEISQASCERDLSPLGATRIDQVRACVVGSSSTQCGYTYRDCRGLPTQALDVPTTCSEVLAVCPALPRATCETALDIYGTGKILDLTYALIRDCMATSSATCVNAFDTCTN